MQYGIPDFRLDKNLVSNSINQCLNEYIEVRLNHTLVSKDNKNNLETKKAKDEKHEFTIEELKQKGFEYIFICIGMEKSKMLNIHGIDNKNVIGANDFLRNAKNNKDAYKGKSFGIIGGGNVAIDSARMAKRLGPESTIIYRRTKEEMPANKSEVIEAEQEQVEFIFKSNVINIESANDKLNLELDTGEKLHVDYLIVAIGASINSEYLDDEIEMEDNGLIKIKENGESNLENIFVGGDLVHNKSSVAWAIKNGRDVAYEICKRF